MEEYPESGLDAPQEDTPADGARRSGGALAPLLPPALLAVVGLGGSAGALDGYERFFLGLPSGGHMAFVVVAHQDPASRGVMPELLARCTGLPVTEVQNDLLIEPDRVYIAPPGQNVTVLHGHLRLHPFALGQNLTDEAPPLPIDGFLASLALDQGHRAVAVILSGMGQDGAQGIRAVHEHGGLVLVQDPATAEYPSMPRSAVASLVADQVLSAEELAARLYSLVTRQPGLRQEDLYPEEGRLSASLQSILLLIRAQTGHDFTGYKQSTILRRVGRRMQMHNLGSIGQYARYVRETPGEVTALYKDLTINVTSFFRDPEAFARFREQAQRYLQAHGPELGTYRVWTPGCSTGEEAYSLAITLTELLGELGLSHTVKVQIFATDIDEDSVAVARLGRYSPQIAYMVSPQRLERFFTSSGEGFVVRPELREQVVFAIHNTFGDPPFTRLDLLCCRNMLIYLGAELQRQLMPLFHYTLKEGGLLFLGPSETTGASRELFTPLDSQWKLFRREVGQAQPLTLNYGPAMRPPAATRSERAPAFRPLREADTATLVNSVLLAEFTPPSVVVTPRGEIVHVVGRTGPYLELALGRIGTNVLEMARDGLRYELSAALKQVQTGGREVVQRGLRTEVDGHYRSLDLIVRPLKLAQQEPLLLIIFNLLPPGEAAPGAAASGEQEPLIRDLERELNYSRQYLQSNLEEMDVSIEQLKTTNEELQTTNEELQSSNEELMTSKEELQSLNEELITVNAEHQMIITDLAQANDDMKNLLDSAGIATVFLDNTLKIKRFTPRITGIINLIASDVGRPITHLVTNLRYEHLERDTREVLRTLASFETNVQTRYGQWHLMKIAPYRTFDNFIDGVVIVFTSITAIRHLEKALSVSTLYADEAINAFPDPFIVLDPELRVVSANRAFYELLRLSPQQAVGERLPSLGDQPFAPLENVLRGVLQGEGSLSNYTVPFEVPRRGVRIMKITARHLVSADGAAELALLTLEDVTELLQQAAEKGVESILQSPPDDQTERP
jgi:two-component system, chemotaxis family, CheB/CheR fusion protein